MDDTVHDPLPFGTEAPRCLSDSKHFGRFTVTSPYRTHCYHQVRPPPPGVIRTPTRPPVVPFLSHLRTPFSSSRDSRVLHLRRHLPTCSSTLIDSLLRRGRNRTELVPGGRGGISLFQSTSLGSRRGVPPVSTDPRSTAKDRRPVRRQCGSDTVGVRRPVNLVYRVKEIRF